MKEDYLEKAFAGLHIHIAYLDPKFNFLRVNDAYAQGAGHEPDYFVGKNHFDLFPHEENEKIFRHVAETGEPYSAFAKPFRYPDKPELGVTYWDWNLQPIKNDQGEIEGLLLSLLDVTEKEKTLKDYARLATAIENATEGILIFNRNRKILYVNSSFLKASGFSKEDLVGKNTHLLRNDLYDEQLHNEISDVISHGHVWKGTYKRQRKDNTYYDVDMTIFPLLDGTEGDSEFVIIERDVTDELKLQQRIRQIQKMEALGTLAAGVAHDFNNILLPIVVNTELALMEVSEDSAAQEYLKLSLEAAERGQELVKQIIAFSRPSDQEMKPIRIGPIVEEALHLLKSTLPSNIKITQHLEDLSGFVLADSSQIHQVLLNLFSNAIHAMRENGGELTVELRNVLLDEQEMKKYPELKSEKCLKLKVSDTGCGIPGENIEKIFDPFFTTKSRGEGSGMGLSVVHGIVKSSGGGIETCSEEGEGTTFDIYIPLIKEQPMEENDQEHEIPRGHERILLIDDEESALKSMESVLKHLGYDVSGRKDPGEALKIFNAESDNFDLVITDQIMPELSGLELSKKILKVRPDIPILICTGFSDRIDKQNVNNIGISEVVFKPFRMGEIARIVRRILDNQEKMD